MEFTSTLKRFVCTHIRIVMYICTYISIVSHTFGMLWFVLDSFGFLQIYQYSFLPPSAQTYIRMYASIHGYCAHICTSAMAFCCELKLLILLDPWNSSKYVCKIYCMFHVRWKLIKTCYV